MQKMEDGVEMELNQRCNRTLPWQILYLQQCMVDVPRKKDSSTKLMWKNIHKTNNQIAVKIALRNFITC